MTDMKEREENYTIAFEIISYSGEAKGLAMNAIKLAKKGEYQKAENDLAESEKALNEAHNRLFELVTQEAQGNLVSVNILLVHAQDHLTLATIANEQAQLALDLYHQISELK